MIVSIFSNVFFGDSMVLKKFLHWCMCFLLLYNLSLLSSEKNYNSDYSDEESEDQMILESLKELINQIKNEEQEQLKQKFIQQFNEEIEFVPVHIYLDLLDDNQIFTDQKSTVFSGIKSLMGDGMNIYQDWVLIRNFYANNGADTITSTAIEHAFDAASMHLNYKSASKKEDKEYFKKSIENLFSPLSERNISADNITNIYNFFTLFFKDRFVLKFGDEKSIKFTEEDKIFFSLIKDPKGKNSNCLQMLNFLISKSADCHESRHQPTIIRWQTLKKEDPQQRKNSIPFRSLKADIDGNLVIGCDVLPYFSRTGFEYFLTTFGLEFGEGVKDYIYNDTIYSFMKNYTVFDQDISLYFAVPDWVLMFGGNDFLPLPYAIHSYNSILTYFKKMDVLFYLDLVRSMGINTQTIFNPVSKVALEEELIEIWLRSNSATDTQLLALFPKARILIETIKEDIKKIEGRGEKRKKAKSTNSFVKKKSKESKLPKRNCLTGQPKVNDKTLVVPPTASSLSPPKAPTQNLKTAKKAPPKENKKKGKRGKKKKKKKENLIELEPSQVPHTKTKETQAEQKSQKTFEPVPSQESNRLEITSRAEVPTLLHPPKSTKYPAQAVKNSLEINLGLVEWYNTVKASTLALFYGPRLITNLPWVHRANQEAVRSVILPKIKCLQK
jgi:hypothetical protein